MSESCLEDKCAAARLGIWLRDGAAVYWFHYVIKKIVQKAHSGDVGAQPAPAISSTDFMQRVRSRKNIGP